MKVWQKVRSQLWQRRAFYEKVTLQSQERLHHAFILELKELLVRMSHEKSLEPLTVYHLDMQSSFKSCINYTNGTPQLCWSWSSWLQNCRFGLAVGSHRLWQEPSMESSQVLAGRKSCLEKSTNTSIVCENRRGEIGWSKGRECCKLWTNIPSDFYF